MTRTLTIIPEDIEGNYLTEYQDTDVIRPSFSYLHRKLEKAVGYDIFGLLRSELLPNEIEDNWVTNELPEGVYPCICMDKPCTYFRWSDNRRFAGLVVFNDDTEGYQDALYKYENKISTL